MSREPGLRQLKKERTTRAIMDTALELIRKQGYEQTTVEEIVRRVEVSQPTFYNYFSSLDDVLRRLAGEILEKWAREGEGEGDIPRLASTRDVLRAVAREMADEISGERNLWKAIFLADAFNPARAPEQSESRERASVFQQRVLKRGRERGDIGKKFPLEFLGNMLDNIQFGICADWCLSDAEDSLRKRLDKGLDFFLKGAG